MAKYCLQSTLQFQKPRANLERSPVDESCSCTRTSLTMSLQQLKRITERDVARSSTSPPTSMNVYAKVVTIHDGDTCDLVFYRNSRLERFKSRLLGINSPELRTGSSALKSRDFLAWLCLGFDPGSFPRQTQPWTEAKLQDSLNRSENVVYAEFHGLGGYGRPLVTLKREPGSTKSFNQMLMDNGYASKYT